MFDMHEILPGFIFCALTVIGVNLLGREPGREVQAEFYEVEQAVR